MQTSQYAHVPSAVISGYKNWGNRSEVVCAGLHGVGDCGVNPYSAGRRMMMMMMMMMMMIALNVVFK